MQRVGAVDLSDYLRSQREISRLLIEGSSLEEVAPQFVSTIVELLGWDAGAIWKRDDGALTLQFVSGWSTPTLDAEPLWQLSRGLEFELGEGLPGRAWQSGETAWIPSLGEDAGFVRAQMAEALGLRAAFAIPVPPGPASGVKAVVEFYTTWFTEQSPELLAVLANFADQLDAFIARRRTEGSLAAERHLNAAVLQASLDAIVGMSTDGLVVEFNPAAEALFGYRREDAIGRELASLLVPEALRDRHREALQRTVETGHGKILDRRIELPALRKDGSQIEIELTVTRTGVPGAQMFTGFIRDIGDRNKVERVRQHLAEVVDSTQDAMLSKDLDGIVTSWNRGAERIYGYGADQAIGRHISFLIPEDHANEERLILDKIADGERIETYETERIRADGVRIDVSLTVSPIRTSRGVVGASVVARDVTAEKRARRAQDFLIATTRQIESSLDPTETARMIVSAAVPELAELCLVDLVRADGQLGDSVVAAVDPGIASDLERLRRDSPLSTTGEHPVAQVLRERRPMVWHDLTDPAVVESVAQSDEHRRLIAAAGYRSAAVVPLIARGRTLGAISFLHTTSDRRYDTEDLDFLGELGDRAAMALDNARLYYERDRVARSLQRGLRPPQPTSVPGLEIAVVFEPAGEGIEIGGDVYDVLPTEQGCWILVADVAGKGSDAAAVSVALRHSVRGLTRVIDDPADVLSRVNELLLLDSSPNDLASAILIRMDRASAGGWEFCLAAAGHPPAVHAVAGEAVMLGGGSVIGAWPEPPATRHEARLAPDDVLAICTDGWLEVGPPSTHLGPDEFAAAVASSSSLAAQELADTLRADAIGRGGGRSLRDDLVVLVLRPTQHRDGDPIV